MNRIHNFEMKEMWRTPTVCVQYFNIFGTKRKLQYTFKSNQIELIFSEYEIDAIGMNCLFVFVRDRIQMIASNFSIQSNIMHTELTNRVSAQCTMHMYKSLSYIN